MPIQRHVVVTPGEDGGVEIHPMKDWLRRHPDRMPPGVDPDPSNSTSHKLRAELRKMGWGLEMTPTEVRLLAPGLEEKVDLESVLGPTGAVEGEEEGASFALEHQLRDFLAGNLSVVSINGRKLALYSDANGSGVEYPTAVGPIDILAIDNEGSLYVFELKRASSPDRALGQVARYMGWLKQGFAKDKNVYGVIVAKTISDKLKFARAVVPNIYLFEYEVSFTLKQAHDLSNP